MASVKYTYSILNDFPSGNINISKFENEIRKSNITVALDFIGTSGDVIDIWFKASISTAEKTTLDGDISSPAGGLIAAHDNSPNPPEETYTKLSHKLTSDDRIRVAVEKSNSSSKDFYTHNWADKTTWFTKAVCESGAATNAGDNTTYNLPHLYIIDTYHGKITQEDTLVNASGDSYRVSVWVNGSGKVEQDPHYGTGGDYLINYPSGQITFLSALQPSDSVTAAYHYQDNGEFTIKPDAGKKLIIELAEVQFSSDVDINDTIVFKTMGYVDVFAPHLTPVPYPSLTLIPIRTFRYKTMKDYQNAAIKSYPGYPSGMGGSSWRGQTYGVHILDWDYQRGLTVSSAAGMEIRIYTEHGEEFGGSYGTATFYCAEEDED